MMDCAQYRRALLADPHESDAEMSAHADSCPECAAYAADLRRFEDRLDRALRLDVSAHVRPKSTVVPLRSRGARAARPRSRPRGWLAAAAGVLLAVAVAAGLWLGASGRSLAADVVAHMAGEPDAWARTETPVPPPRLDAVMRESHIRLKESAGLVTYANSCRFRGHQVPHLVVQTGVGPVTVMVLTRESAKAPERFHESGYQGMILPVPGHGSLAVLERGPAFDQAVLESLAARVRDAIDWSG